MMFVLIVVYAFTSLPEEIDGVFDARRRIMGSSRSNHALVSRRALLAFGALSACSCIRPHRAFAFTSAGDDGGFKLEGIRV